MKTRILTATATRLRVGVKHCLVATFPDDTGEDAVIAATALSARSSVVYVVERRVTPEVESVADLAETKVTWSREPGCAHRGEWRHGLSAEDVVLGRRRE